MNIRKSLRSFFKILREASIAGKKLGITPLKIVAIAYEGRWCDRRRKPYPTRQIHAKPKIGGAFSIWLKATTLSSYFGVFLDEEYHTNFDSDGIVRVLDLGANIGMGSLYLARKFPGANFVCVEPDPRNIALLQKNLDASQVRYSLQRVAVGAKRRFEQFRMADNSTCSALGSSLLHGPAETCEVLVETVDNILAVAGWDRVDLAKIDIEGSEAELLFENNGWLAKVDHILIEIHPNVTPAAIGEVLAKFGFSMKRNGEGREPVYVATRRRTSV